MSYATTRPPQAAQPDSKVKHLQNQADELKGIMKENIDLAVNRGEVLADIEQKAEHLNEAAGQFKKGAKQVERRMWWKDMKLRLIICAIVIILLIVIIVPIVVNNNKKEA
ncbi:synaptobrevin-domain-containing protein [Syncephalis fuscata]|nr:synaptobrevin-domain-containing protein [Syncephalis fuscata]